MPPWEDWLPRWLDAILPFEPEAYVKLGGPRCVYVGHPLIEHLADLRPRASEAERRGHQYA